jgi:subtilisin family serine protease
VNRLNRLDVVELAWLAYLPQPPPQDLSPETPDFTPDQGWLNPIEGVDAWESDLWPGGWGGNIAVANLEYSFTPEHEDLGEIFHAWGYDSGDYAFHGTSVLGQLGAGDNGYGVLGLVPDAEILVLSPFSEPEVYVLAESILAAAEILEPGDVLLIEQQAWAGQGYAPVEVDPAVFDAISAVVDAGIIVVEPAGNGDQDLDSPIWGGWFNRGLRDSGAILVGGGASPLSGLEPRSHYPGGGCYGSRVDVQGWYDSTVTTTNGESGGMWADLWLPTTEDFPGGDGRQGYTRSFGGTSGAGAMVAGTAAAINSVALALYGEPLSPLEMRALLVSTGTPQPEEDLDKPIGPLPDLRRALRYGVLP